MSFGVMWPVALFSQTTTTLLTHANPKEKIGLSALWDIGDFSVNLRETLYGPTSADYSPNGGTYYTNKVPTTAITDIEADSSPGSPTGMRQLQFGLRVTF